MSRSKSERIHRQWEQHLRRACSIAWLFLACGFIIRADVSYDVVRSAKWRPAQVDPSVPWTNAGTFSISPKLYAPVLPGTAQEVIHVHIKDHKLFAVDSRIWHIYDLDAGTLTTVDPETRTYSVESLDAAYNQYRHLTAHSRDASFQFSARKTGKTVNLYGQDATEYEIVATKKGFGRRKIAARALCWIADHSPSAELDEFRTRWAARTNLPFLGDIVPSLAASNAYAAILKAQGSISGHVLGFVTESGSAESQIDLGGRPSSIYDASHYHLPAVQSIENARDAAPELLYDPLVPLLNSNRLVQFNILNFTSNAVDPGTFVIPSSFTPKKIAH
jgi:hypothetical protein